MPDQAKIAGRQPMAVELEAGKKYAFCTCGGSENQPFCDGSHRGTTFTPHFVTTETSTQAHWCLCKRTGNTPNCDGSHAKLPPE